jgi:methylated-DNA-protein-cysteine methyltransferase-like protein
MSLWYAATHPIQNSSLRWSGRSSIPPGSVSTYGQIASMIPPPPGVEPPQYARLGALWVGKAMNAVPNGSGIPWQRVINSQGKISLPAGSSSAERQRGLLEMEGVEFDDQERVSLSVVGWEGPPAEWLQARGLSPPRPLKKDADDSAQLTLF